MKAVVCRAVGPPDSLAVSDEPLPAVGDGELLVRAVGAGVNPVDWKTRGGGLPAKLPKVRLKGEAGVEKRVRNLPSTAVGGANVRQAMRRFLIPGTCPETRTPPPTLNQLFRSSAATWPALSSSPTRAAPSPRATACLR
jgi:hypothetical protein